MINIHEQRINIKFYGDYFTETRKMMRNAYGDRVLLERTLYVKSQ